MKMKNKNKRMRDQTKTKEKIQKQIPFKQVNQNKKQGVETILKSESKQR